MYWIIGVLVLLFAYWIAKSNRTTRRYEQCKLFTSIEAAKQDYRKFDDR